MDSLVYWSNVYQGKVKFASKNASTVIPWEIKTVDPSIKKLIESMNITPGNLLEIGCGTGYDSVYFASLGFNVTAIDISHDVIAAAKKTHADTGVTFVQADFFQGTPSTMFDVVYDRGFMHNYTGRLFEIFEKLNTITSKQAKLIVMTGSIWQPELETCMPPPVSLGEIEQGAAAFFKIILATEIPFVTHDDYNDCVGYIFVLEKIDNTLIYNR